MNNTIGNIYNPIQPSSPYSIFTSGFNYSGNSVSDYQKPHYDIIKVNGKNGAEKLDMGPNSAALLLDMNDPIVWFVQTDAQAIKLVYHTLLQLISLLKSLMYNQYLLN